MHNGRVYLTTANGRVYALATRNGRVQRETIHAEEPQPNGTVRRYGRAGGPVSVFSVAGENRAVAVYQEWDGVVCRDAATGLGCRVDSRRRTGGGEYHGTAVRTPGSNTVWLHGGSSLSLLAMDLLTCEQVSSVDTGGDIYSQSSPAFSPDGSRLVTATWTGVRAHDPAAGGAVRWQRPAAGWNGTCEPGPPPVTSPAVYGSVAYVASIDGVVRLVRLR